MIRISKYGHLKEAKPLFSDYHLIFSRPYNPVQLAEAIKGEYSLKYAEPNGITGTSQTITFNRKSPTQYEYTFMQGWGDCPSGCIHKHFWVFSVSDTNGNSSVNLEREDGSDLSDSS